MTNFYLRHTKPDVILHMAAMCGGIVKNSHYPADFLQINTQMALTSMMLSEK